MGTFEQAVEVVLAHEGGYVDDPDDPGDETRWGITKRDHPKENIWSLTRRRAIEIYREEYWKDDYAKLHQDILDRFFSLLVNAGEFRATQVLQRAARNCGTPKLRIDGKLGPKTINAVRSAPIDRLLREFRIEAAAFYARLCQRNPRLLKYLVGWIRRAVA